MMALLGDRWRETGSIDGRREINNSETMIAYCLPAARQGRHASTFPSQDFFRDHSPDRVGRQP
jgi:hypothetical protein